MGFSTNEPGVLTLAGFKNYSFLMANFGYHVYADVYETSVSDIATHRAALVDFMKSEIQGWTYDISAPAAGTHLTVVRYEKKLGFQLQAAVAREQVAQLKLIETPYTKAHGLFTMSPARHRGEHRDAEVRPEPGRGHRTTPTRTSSTAAS
jgi:hypothetical protein